MKFQKLFPKRPELEFEINHFKRGASVKLMFSIVPIQKNGTKFWIEDLPFLSSFVLDTFHVVLKDHIL